MGQVRSLLYYLYQQKILLSKCHLVPWLMNFNKKLNIFSSSHEHEHRPLSHAKISLVVVATFNRSTLSLRRQHRTLVMNH